MTVTDHQPTPRPVAIIVDPTRLLRWHRWLADELRTRGVADLRWLFVDAPRPVPLNATDILLPAGIRRTLRRAKPDKAALPHAPGPPAGVATLLRLERLLGRVRGDTALDPLSPTDPLYARQQVPRSDDAITIDLRGVRSADGLHLVYDSGDTSETALWQALLAGRAPLISVRWSMDWPCIPMALPAIEDSTNLHAAASMAYARAATALAQAATDMDRLSSANVPRCPAPITGMTATGSVPGFLARAFAKKLRGRLDRALGRAPRWAVAYRQAPKGGTRPPGTLDVSQFSLLEDDGQRYYADPFLFKHEGKLHLFVEEVPDATGRGIISHCMLGPDRRFPTPRPILERPYHLSYPQVFAHAGEIWMIPETSASGAIELYRATAFPDRFELHARLIEGAYHDATFFDYDGRLWIAAGSQSPPGLASGGSSSWDGLSLFHAAKLEGPWAPHPMNPVLVDRRSARPAGNLYRSGGTLFRPAQDCSGGYGSALTLAKLQTISIHSHSASFVEQPVTTLRVGDCAAKTNEPKHHTAGQNTGVAGPHTINWAGGIEVIDLFAPPSWRP